MELSLELPGDIAIRILFWREHLLALTETRGQLERIGEAGGSVARLG
jgi:hypothetical protein